MRYFALPLTLTLPQGPELPLSRLPIHHWKCGSLFLIHKGQGTRDNYFSKIKQPSRVC